jgi:predicted transcriptional regulator of viral defense system
MERVGERVARVAAGQHGVVSWEQLEQCGVTRGSIPRWRARGRLHRVHPGVYAVGHTSLDVLGRVHAALLYCGAEAALSHTTAAWWWRLIDVEPRTVHLTVPGRRRSLPAVRVHHARGVRVAVHNQLPVTDIPRTLLDLAAALSFGDLRRALAEADHLQLLHPGAVEAELGRGRRGSQNLRLALADHLPSLADTLSLLEERFLLLCEDADVPLPEVNVLVAGLKVDALWRGRRLVVELDGHDAHGYAAAAERDRRRELTLRNAGYDVRRYTRQQVTEQADKVVADLRAWLG